MPRHITIQGNDSEGKRTSVSMPAALYDFASRLYGGQVKLRGQVRQWMANDSDSYAVSSMLIEQLCPQELKDSLQERKFKCEEAQEVLGGRIRAFVSADQVELNADTYTLEELEMLCLLMKYRQDDAE